MTFAGRTRALVSLLAASLLCPLIGECAPAREPTELSAGTSQPSALAKLDQEAGRETLQLEGFFARLETLQKESSCLREPATTDREALRREIVASMTRLNAVENELYQLRRGSLFTSLLAPGAGEPSLNTSITRTLARIKKTSRPAGGRLADLDAGFAQAQTECARKRCFIRRVGLSIGGLLLVSAATFLLLRRRGRSAPPVALPPPSTPARI